MCTPPFCSPARRCLGCISLRYGAVLALVCNAAYGLAMVVVHALLLGEMNPPGEAGQLYYPGTAEGEGNAPPSEMIGGEGGGGKYIAEGWMLQILDLDIAWAHELIGFQDYGCLICGLIYGIFVICFTVFTLHSVFHVAYVRQRHVPTLMHMDVGRWFVAFLHLEMILYIALVLCKLPVLCRLQQVYLPSLDSSCEALRFTYLERALVRIVGGSLVTWTFSSYAYLASSGDQSVDIWPGETERAFSNIVQAPQFFTQGHEPQIRTVTQAHVGLPTRVSMSSSMGHSVASASPMVSYAHPAHSVGGHHYLPRASSSMAASSVSNSSHYQAAETQALIKPPVGIH
eukprot:gnl/TRDRNA2_/TRDRNA2_163540_c1_seq1.p1 gnl/TRDRNA2_/TRDRNA2_163540_c1~~gnl/TRDRNA2_/TRDRNA2_163540_c1_seq1.p1  ORF type:complete len:343 (-),score=28.44 gnl/TRDRNA2_/TRDRNA2_163540_c1_seq1:282-1310(-)